MHTAGSRNDKNKILCLPLMMFVGETDCITNIYGFTFMDFKSYHSE